MKYLLGISPRAYVRLKNNSDEVLIVPNPDRGSVFNSPGEAMTAAIKVNDMLGESIVRMVRVLI